MRAALARILVLLALVLAPPFAHAQVFQCVGAHGEPVYSGEPCGTPASSAQSGVTTVSQLASVCAASPTELDHALTRAFQTRDVNLVSGLLLWQGIGSRESQQTLRTLAAWLQQPLTGIKLISNADPPGVAPMSPEPPPATSTVTPAVVYTGLAVTTAGDTTRAFGLVHQDGCWWLTF